MINKNAVMAAIEDMTACNGARGGHIEPLPSFGWTQEVLGRKFRHRGMAFEQTRVWQAEAEFYHVLVAVFEQWETSWSSASSSEYIAVTKEGRLYTIPYPGEIKFIAVTCGTHLVVTTVDGQRTVTPLNEIELK